jgi:hypothetical protein
VSKPIQAKQSQPKKKKSDASKTSSNKPKPPRLLLPKSAKTLAAKKGISEPSPTTSKVSSHRGAPPGTIPCVHYHISSWIVTDVILLSPGPDFHQTGECPSVHDLSPQWVGTESTLTDVPDPDQNLQDTVETRAVPRRIGRRGGSRGAARGGMCYKHSLISRHYTSLHLCSLHGVS